MSPRRDPTYQPKIDHVRVFHASLVVKITGKIQHAPFRGAKQAKLKVTGKKSETMNKP